MRNERIQVATHLEDLDMEKLPVGTRILTASYKVMELDVLQSSSEGKEPGRRYWIEPGTLQPFHVSFQHWLPAYFLPPAATE